MVHQHYGCADRQGETAHCGWAGHILCVSPSSHAPVPIALATREPFKVFIESAPRKQTTLAAIKDTLQRRRGSLRWQAVESQAQSTVRAFPASPVRWAALARTTRKKAPARTQDRQWSACPGH